jgi:inward rectifier potassium channel
MQRPPNVPPGARRVTQQGNTFYVIGDERAPLRDAYHTFLRLGWWSSLAILGALFFAANLVFAVVYHIVGGVAEVRPDSFLDALSFSVQTMATVGYGVMHPVSAAATVVMIVESVVGIIIIALVTGLVFTKFSRPTTRIAFSKYAVITKHEGKPTLMLRMGNRRGNVIVEATVHVVAVMTTTTLEGDIFYRATDLRMVRDRQVGMTRGWTIMHVIDETSPLWGLDQAAAKRLELELYMSLTGIDDTSKQTVHAIHTFNDTDVRFGYRFVDTITPCGGELYLVDLRNFDAIVPDTTPRVSVPA